MYIFLVSQGILDNIHVALKVNLVLKVELKNLKILIINDIFLISTTT